MHNCVLNISSALACQPSLFRKLCLSSTVSTYAGVSVNPFCTQSSCEHVFFSADKRLRRTRKSVSFFYTWTGRTAAYPAKTTQNQLPTGFGTRLAGVPGRSRFYSFRDRHCFVIAEPPTLG